VSVWIHWLCQPDLTHSATIVRYYWAEGLRVQEQPCVIWGVIVSINIIVVQGETVRLRAVVIREQDNEVDYLLTNLALQITIPFGYAAKAPAMRRPFEEDVMPNELLTCGVKECEHGVGWWYRYRLEARGRSIDDCFYYL